MAKKGTNTAAKRAVTTMASTAATTKVARLLPSLSLPTPRFYPSSHLGAPPETVVSFPSSISVSSKTLVSARSGRSLSVVAAAGPKRLLGSLTNTEGLKFAVVVSVPGSFEIPVVAQKLAKSGEFHAILCIGAVIRGDTTHYDAVANSAASGVLSAGLSGGVPCIFGVLTCDDMDQALNWAGGKSGNKGAETALTAIEMASLFKHRLN